MNGEIGNLRFVPATPVVAPARSQSRQEAGPEAAVPSGRFETPAATVTLSSIPGAPPEDVLAELDRARERVAKMVSENRELHFAKDERSGRIVVEVRTGDGEVLRTIPPSGALAVVSGAAEVD